MTSPLTMPPRRIDHAATTRPPRPAAVTYIDDDPHCFVCSRHTDHWGEHDDLVDAGLATYGPDGSVYPTRTA